MYPSQKPIAHFSLSTILLLTACFMLTVSFFLTGSVNAQTEVTGAIEGRVTNSQNPNEPISGATVQIINLESQVQTATKTDADGRFIKNQLPPGRYKVVVKADKFQTKEIDRVQPIDVELTNKAVPIPISLDPVSLAAATPSPSPTAPSQPGVTPTPSPSTSPATTGRTVATRGKTVEEDSDIRNEINTTDGRRGGGYREKEVSALPLGGTTLVRSFDELALLLPGVAAPPQTQGGVAGPGVGAGVGSAGQFSVNGLRSRSNNFTIDGSDNNDTDIGVRRQGFLALVPQPIESIEAFRVITLLAPAQYGRNFGAQVNAISKSGTSQTHGTFFGFFNSSQLNARNFFDSIGGNAATPLQANGQNVLLRTIVINPNTGFIVPSGADQTIPIRDGRGGKDSFTLGQGGLVLGGPLVMPDANNPRDRSLFYFFSAEGQILNANQEASFAVPTIAQRGIFNSGVTGVFADPFFRVGDPRRNVVGFTQNLEGAGVFSLFPFPNNPNGIYGANTFTEALPASGFGKVLSGKINGNFYLGGKRQDVTARYNFTDDARTIPVTGDAIFSSLRPRVRTQNFSTFLNSEITSRISNEVRASYGRTRLVFDSVPDRNFLIPSQELPGQPFLLNAPYLADITAPNGPGQPNTGPVIFARLPQDPLRRTTENAIGPVGEIRVAGFSPLGVDVFNFPQRRVNNTYQLADTLNVSHAKHRFAFGEDIRRVELNSDLPRNALPLLTYTGQVGSDQTLIGNVQATPQDFVAAGAPTGAFQTLNTTGTSAISLRNYEYNFFGQDEWRIHSNLSISYGLRYEYNTPPRELNRSIESSFNNSLVGLLSPLSSYIGGRTNIYDTQHTNFAPRIGIAYARRLFGSDQETVFRAGYGIYYDTILGAVVSQSRNVFPNTISLNFGGGTSQTNVDQLTFFNPAFTGCVGPCNPNSAFRGFVPFRVPGTLNQANIAGFGSLSNLLSLANQFFSAGGFGVTLPTRLLKTPMAQHYAFSVEQPLGKSMVLSLAYVGTQGRHLLRINTPNAGENLGAILFDFTVGDINTLTSPALFGTIFPPTVPSPTAISRPSGPNSLLGAVNLIETSASSRYDSLQVQLRGRFRQRFQFQAAYTFAKATDDASDFFDLAGAPALPQDFTNLAAERGPSNFDVRHRISYNLIYTLPAFNNRSHAFRSIFGGLEIASIGQFQTGQPFTVNSVFDVNGDGNFTDRLDSLNGLVVTGDRRQPLRLTTSNTTSLLAADFTDGRIGRNTFRAGSIWTTDLAVAKIVSLSERVKMTFRMEIFNVFNRANFGIPVRFLEAQDFGQATNTVIPGRRIQFALKLNF
jgi:hypothetical protein